MWQKETAPGIYDWEDAIGYCENLTLAGYNDWRLPDRNELQSNIEYSAYDPAIDLAYFDVPAGGELRFYCSTTDYLQHTHGRQVYFQSGMVYFSATKTDRNYMRAE